MKPSNNNIRILSVEILDKVFYKGKNLKREYENSACNLNSRDSAFLKFLVYGVVRLKNSIDTEISSLYKGSYRDMGNSCKNILRVGIYQIEFMNSVPDYAAVNSTVELAKLRNYKFSKIVNAILNRYIREGRSVSLEDILQNYSKPFIDELKKRYSYKEIHKICLWNEKKPILWFRVREEYVSEISDLFSGGYCRFDSRLNYIGFESYNDEIDENLKKDVIFSQSPGSGLVVDLINVVSEDRVIDACAAPGGKAKCILELSNSPELVYINDFSKKRYLKMKSELKDSKATMLNLDASQSDFPKANKILVDVPCSSTGTIQKNPDIKWKRINVPDLAKSQYEILENMSKNLKTGGAIVYSTCSIYNRENFEVVQKFLDLNRNFKIDRASKYIDEKFVDGNGCLNIFSPKHNIESIFAARLIKMA